jgi:hypothetical protein
LAFAVSAQGGPRSADGTARSRGKVDSARQLTGPVNNLQATVAGDPESTTEFVIRPVTSHPAGAYNLEPDGCYDNGDIAGSALTLPGGPCRVFLNMFIRNWDGNMSGAPRLRGFQAKFDAMSLMSGAGCDLTYAFIPCANTPQCATITGANGTGESGALCNAQVPGGCNYAWRNNSAGRTDGYAAFDPFSCGTNTWDIGFFPDGPLYFGASDPDQPGLGIFCTLPWGGTDVYFGSMAVDAAACAAGTYTLAFRGAGTETIATDPNNDLIGIAALIPATITIPTGSCCFGIGGPAPGCTDGLTQGECNALAPVAQWDEGGVCLNPPTDDGCCACLVAADCNDGDACTNDSCSNCICSNAPKPSWTAGECCDALSGAECTPTQAGVCDDAACSLPVDQYGRAGRGVCENTLRPADDPCKGDGDDNPCTFDDVCDGLSAGGCAGTDVNSSNIACTTDADCVTATGLSAPTCVSGFCNCSLVPDLTIDIGESGKEDPNCFDIGAKVTATVHVAAATAPVNGGQFRIEYDTNCLSYNSAVGVAPYTDDVYGPIVDDVNGVIFYVVGVGFGVPNGPAGNADMIELSFDKVGNGCNSCDICFGDVNPQHTYLVDSSGQRIGVNPICSKAIFTNNELTVHGPGFERKKVNTDCDEEGAVVTWDTPDVDATCGPATLTCTGESNTGENEDDLAMNGGQFDAGIHNICCTASTDYCDNSAETCWTVEVNEQVGIDVTIALSPTAQGKPADDLTRCIKFTLYTSSLQPPYSFESNVTFGGDGDFVGKSEDAIKIPTIGQWGCISAWDQLHTLRSCYTFDPHGGDCVNGRLQAWFEGDPAFCVGGICGNWLIGGNLDGWKKDVDGSNPSLFAIDVLDYGTFVSQWGEDYGSGDTPCGTAGPNADINGDGVSNMLDFNFIQQNFLTTAKICCGEELPADGITPITEISVRELREMGLGDLAAGDVNGDGLLNVDDMNAFGQGARPDNKGVRGVRKGAGSR